MSENGNTRNPIEENAYKKHFIDLSLKGNWLMQMPGAFSHSSTLASPSLFARQTLLYLESIVLYHNTPTGFSVRRGNYNSYQIVYTLSGQGKLIYMGKEYLLSAGSCFLIDCKKEHFYYTFGEETWIHHGMQFNGHQMPSIFDYLVQLNSIVTSLDDQDSINGLHERLAAAASSKLSSADIIINQLLFDIIGKILLQNQFTSEKQLSPKIMEICQYIDANYMKIDTIDEIAQNCFISKYHMCREFKRQTGKTIATYLTDKKLLEAKSLLLRSDLPVSIIARTVGFESENYFFFVFKKTEGITPLQYRKQMTPIRN